MNPSADKSLTEIEREDRVLANIIKRTHSELRQKVQENKDNTEKLWKEHVSELKGNDSKTYAKAMENLSNQHWANESRLNWICQKLNLYFVENDNSRFFSRIQRRQYDSSDTDKKYVETSQIYKILDVGSCHNPLNKILAKNEKFEITAIDLSPATSSVYFCDFIQVPINKDFVLNSENEVQSLPQNYYDSVVFCLLLEYLPCPKLRLCAVKKAIEVLKPFGILIIVTPDSSHQGKNMNQIKTWRWALTKLGMIRIYTEKLKHVNCMAYVKIEPKTSYDVLFTKEMEQIENRLDCSIKKSLETAFYIPQDC